MLQVAANHSHLYVALLFHSVYFTIESLGKLYRPSWQTSMKYCIHLFCSFKKFLYLSFIQCTHLFCTTWN